MLLRENLPWELKGHYLSCEISFALHLIFPSFICFGTCVLVQTYMQFSAIRNICFLLMNTNSVLSVVVANGSRI